eukprot:Protomagalhaensia_wolfi_Nauph_80__1609@NODE_1996_length_1250_cov_2663_589595_g1562_i0_p1_GENE_NODE_1996_length_1250_cov_2663_589595_g1562_i0NODE_1996_length_1250_cov_2663_589595_g1562_i0_p1_ORF_typecomplete_len198_score31_82HIM1/PF08732_10/0_0035_NODE_1996_length_1250_cov_2663_589595_g1562_i04501043
MQDGGYVQFRRSQSQQLVLLPQDSWPSEKVSYVVDFVSLQTEEDIKALDFDFFAIARPGIIRVERGKGRSFFEKAMVATTNTLDFGSYMSVKGSDIAGGLIYSTFSRFEATAPNQPKFDTYGSHALCDLSSKLRSFLKQTSPKVDKVADTVETAPKPATADEAKTEPLESIPTAKGSEVASLVSEDVKATDQVFTKV